MSRKSITAVLATAALFSVLSGAVFAATSMKKEEINPQPQTSGEIALTAKLLPFALTKADCWFTAVTAKKSRPIPLSMINSPKTLRLWAARHWKRLAANLWALLPAISISQTSAEPCQFTTLTKALLTTENARLKKDC